MNMFIRLNINKSDIMSKPEMKCGFSANDTKLINMNYSKCYYDNRDHPTEIVGQIIKRILKIYEPDIDNLSLAEFGCGTGRIALPIGRIFSPITCIDKNKEALNILRTKALGEAIQARCILCDFERQAPIKDESFDIIILSHTLHWISNLDEFFSNIYRYLRKKGILLIILYDKEILDQMLFFKMIDSTVLEIQKEITPSLDTIKKELYNNFMYILEIFQFVDTKKYTINELNNIIEFKGTLALQILYQRHGNEVYQEIKVKAREKIENAFMERIYLSENEIETLLVCKKL